MDGPTIASVVRLQGFFLAKHPALKNAPDESFSPGRQIH
jgi:hypothetical protein